MMLFPHNPSGSQRQVLRAGFTLLEVLIYIAILLLALGAVITAFFTMRDTLERGRLEREVADAGALALEQISREVRSASGLGVGSVFDSDSGTLALTQDAATSTTFSLSGGAVMVEQTGSALAPLTPDSVTVDRLVFRHYTHADDAAEAVRAELTISASSPYAATTKTFYVSAVMRGSYE